MGPFGGLGSRGVEGEIVCLHILSLLIANYHSLIQGMTGDNGDNGEDGSKGLKGMTGDLVRCHYDRLQGV